MVALSYRKPLAAWKPGSLLWTTQFNDLRDPHSLGGTPSERLQRVLLEIKSHALLLPRMLIRDADVVNHITLQDLILKNTDGIRGAFESGTIVLGIRSNAASFSEINEKTGENRAFPNLYLEAQRRLTEVEQFLHQRRIEVAEMPGAGPLDKFGRNLQTILVSDMLSQEEDRLLRGGIAIATDRSATTNHLRFGDLYNFLVREKNCDPYGDLVQWCRAAHVLVLPEFAPSTADRDLRPEMVAVILNYRHEQINDPDKWISLYPNRILPEPVLLTMRFDKIAELRAVGQQLGYFDSALAVQQAFGTASFDETYKPTSVNSQSIWRG
jgi:hypothetical protein